ncbi:MAG: hypothetical protein Q7I98_06845 [Erysipelotrichaceae bacterium]|nr:hypothetical protein [Erysipelotrichaceae bacterium]
MNDFAKKLWLAKDGKTRSKLLLVFIFLILLLVFYFSRHSDENSAELTFLNHLYSVNMDQRLQIFSDIIENPLDAVNHYYSNFNSVCSQTVIMALAKNRIPLNFEISAYEKGYTVKISDVKFIETSSSRRNFTLNLDILDSQGNPVQRVLQSGQIETDHERVTYFFINNREDLKLD